MYYGMIVQVFIALFPKEQIKQKPRTQVNYSNGIPNYVVAASCVLVREKLPFEVHGSL